MSFDHRPDEPSEKRRVERLGGRVTQTGYDLPRLNGMLAVSRGFGDYDLQPMLSAEPFIKHVELTHEDVYLILACDGLWDEYSDEEVGQLVRACCRQKAAEKDRATDNDDGDGDGEAVEDPFVVANMLMNSAYTHGSYDNISVVVVQLSSGHGSSLAHSWSHSAAATTPSHTKTKEQTPAHHAWRPDDQIFFFFFGCCPFYK